MDYLIILIWNLCFIGSIARLIKIAEKRKETEDLKKSNTSIAIYTILIISCLVYLVVKLRLW